MKTIDYWVYLAFSAFKLFLFSLYTATPFSFGFFLISLSSALLLSSWTLLIDRRKRRWILLSLLALHSVLLISDVWYYRYFGNLLSVQLIPSMTQMNDVGGGFLSLIRWTDFFFFADFLLFLIFILVLKKRRTSYGRTTNGKLAAVIAAIGLLIFTAPLLSSIAKGERWLTGDAASNMREYYELGFWGYHGYDFGKGVVSIFRDPEPSGQDKALLLEAAAEIGTQNSGEQPNVILVQLESLQTSVIGQEIGGEEVTPYLNQLEEEMLYFPSFHHQTHEGRTSDAEFVINTSLHPLRTGSVYTRFPDSTFAPLPETLRKGGYDTAAMHAYEASFWNRNTVYEHIGFSRFFSEKDYPDTEKIGMAINDEDFFRTSVEHIRKLEEPYYAFMIALSSHIPFTIPEDKKELALPGYEDELVRNYYHTVHYVDGAVEVLVDELKQQGMWDDSLVIFYGDHDSGLTEQGREMANKHDANGTTEQFELFREVPLWIKPPNLPEGDTVETVGGQIDLAPTILELAGIDQGFMLGTSLLSDTERLVVFRDGSFRKGDVYFEPDLTTTSGTGECYSIESGEQIDDAECEPYINDALDQLRISDTVIEDNGLDYIEQ
ncbi:LTA synthase family protein [Planococcus sp. SSTMD024]|uniref:LTA synthase family protein n=1 Tax=Planococcus sp. SSTMD024 TaxID=3242163 RepID=UPI00351F45B4